MLVLCGCVFNQSVYVCQCCAAEHSLYCAGWNTVFHSVSTRWEDCVPHSGHPSSVCAQDEFKYQGQNFFFLFLLCASNQDSDPLGYHVGDSCLKWKGCFPLGKVTWHQCLVCCDAPIGCILDINAAIWLQQPSPGRRPEIASLTQQKCAITIESGDVSPTVLLRLVFVEVQQQYCIMLPLQKNKKNPRLLSSF